MSEAGRSRHADSGCVVCGDVRTVDVRDAAALAGDADRARAFHLRRLERRAASELEERASFTQESPARLASCLTCGLLQRRPRPSSEQLERLYAVDPYPKERLPEMLASQRELYRRKMPLLRRLLTPRVRVLEVGSFVGGFLDLCREEGWAARGVDPGRQVATFCHERGLDVIPSTVEDVADVLEAVDLVAIWNTFDQLAEPGRALQAVSHLLPPGGLLVIRVPHAAFYLRGLTALDHPEPGRRAASERILAWNNLLSFPYLHGFSLETLDALVQPHGFVREAWQGDVLPLLAGSGTSAWAVREEVRVKRSILRRIGLERLRGDPEGRAAPWLDVYYRRA